MRALAGAAVLPPLILVSAFNHSDHLSHSDVRIDGYLHKPTCPKHLYTEIARCLGLLAPGSEPISGPARAERVSLQPFHGADVLLVEDVEINQEVIIDLLQGVGLRVRVANNGVEALQEVAKQVPDCILMDCQMPEMDGYEATRRLRANPQLRDLPIIALTANVMTSDRDRCLDAGMNSLVGKPLHIPTLFQELARWMRPPAATAARDDAGAPQPQSTPDQPDSLPASPMLSALPGVDTAYGLSVVGGNLALYLKVLKKFRDKLGADFESTYRQAWQDEQWDTATRLAHSLKGVALTLGAKTLGELLLELEQSTRSREAERIRPALATLLPEMARVMLGLRQLED